jgi:hypothetical protein
MAIFHDTIASSVNDGGIFVTSLDSTIEAIREVNMAMNKVSRPEAIHKPEKGLKATVGIIGAVMDTEGRGVGKEDIEVATIAEAIKKEARHDPINTSHHLSLTKLMGRLWFIADGATEARKQKTIVASSSAINAYGPTDLLEHLTAGGFFGAIMITKNIVTGLAEHGHYKLKVVDRQIAATEDKLGTLKALLYIQAINRWNYFIANSEDLHRPPPLCGMSCRAIVA